MVYTEPLQEVALAQMLDARERRAYRQRELLAAYGKPLMCFTMNIAGPVKNSPLIRKGFLAGVEDFRLQLCRVKASVLYEEMIDEVTGNEAFFVVDLDGRLLKQLTCELEDADEMGRLYDMDVILPSGEEPDFGRKVDRQELGFPGRKCLICGGPAKECSSRRIHSVPQLREKTEEILTRCLEKRYSARIAELAVRSLLYEVSVSPKPGLVDRFHNGSHKDMDIYTFLSSGAALWPYFRECAEMGLRAGASGEELPELFARLRLPGKLAEDQMLRATGGVNTHKGAIFSMGILCAAAGAAAAGPGETAVIRESGVCGNDGSEVYGTGEPDVSGVGRNGQYGAGGPENWRDSERILRICAGMTHGLTAADFAGLTPETAKTAGQKLYLQYGITGVRGQMEEGLPVVSRCGLPLLKKLLAEGKSADQAGAATLLAIMAHMTDTNLIARSDVPTQQQASKAAEELLKQQECPDREAILGLDQSFVEKNLSPGGSADLLAVCWMLYFLSQEAGRS